MDFQKYCTEFSEWFAVCNFKDKVTPEGYMRLKSLPKEYRGKFNEYFDKVVGKTIFVERTDSEIAEMEASRLLQRERDLNRLYNSEMRGINRYITTIKDLEEKIRETMHTYKFSTKLPPKRKHDPEAPEMVIQVTDAHFNELIDLPCNKYNFHVAAARLRKYADTIIKYAKDHNVTKGVLAFTGDLLNSNRRKEEIIYQINNRTNAAIIAVDILQQFIQHISTQLDLRLVTVSGNESRMDFELGYAEKMLSDNFDNVIFHMLRKLFADSSIKFEWGESFEYYTEVNGNTIFFTHGISVKDDIEKEVQRIMGRISNREGARVRYVILGHKHSSRIGDTYARGSSLCGANPYSKYALNLISRAAQNFFLVYSNGSIDGIKVDLQDVTEDGYEFMDLEDKYNSTSHHKITKVR